MSAKWIFMYGGKIWKLFFSRAGKKAAKGAPQQKRWWLINYNLVKPICFCKLKMATHKNACIVSEWIWAECWERPYRLSSMSTSTKQKFFKWQTYPKPKLFKQFHEFITNLDQIWHTAESRKYVGPLLLSD